MATRKDQDVVGVAPKKVNRSDSSNPSGPGAHGQGPSGSNMSGHGNEQKTGTPSNASGNAN